jgi:hypothetical protein
MYKAIRSYLGITYYQYKKRKKFREQIAEFELADQNRKLPLDRKDLFPCLDDATETTGFDYHYIYHPAWAARIIRQNNPAKHVDISSTLTFCSMLSAFVPTEFYDYRPAELTLSGLKSERANLTDLFFEAGSIESLSCMHTIEHIGLGRYGDPIDPEGDLKAINELKRVTAVNGTLLMVTPVGKPRIQFNAHRIYSFEMMREYFRDFELLDFSLVLDNGKFVNNASPSLVAAQRYGCGCFYFKKVR